MNSDYYSLQRIKANKKLGSLKKSLGSGDLFITMFFNQNSIILESCSQILQIITWLNPRYKQVRKL